MQHSCTFYCKRHCERIIGYLVHGKLLPAEKVLVFRYLSRCGIHVTHIWFRNVQALPYYLQIVICERKYISPLCFSQKNGSGTESFESNINLNRTFWTKTKFDFFHSKNFVHSFDILICACNVLRACRHKCKPSECL